MTGHLALIEHDVLFRIDAAGDERGGDFSGIAGQFSRTAPDRHRLGQRVHVDDAIQAVVRLLQLHKIDDGAEVIPQMQIAGWLDA